MATKTMLMKLWNDEVGAILAIEWLFLATILGIGLVVGFTAVREAANHELSEVANAVLALSQQYTVSGTSGCCADTEGSQAVDSPALVTDPTCVAPTQPSIIDLTPCN